MYNNITPCFPDKLYKLYYLKWSQKKKIKIMTFFCHHQNLFFDLTVKT